MGEAVGGGVLSDFWIVDEARLSSITSLVFVSLLVHGVERGAGQ